MQTMVITVNYVLGGLLVYLLERTYVSLEKFASALHGPNWLQVAGPPRALTPALGKRFDLGLASYSTALPVRTGPQKALRTGCWRITVGGFFDRIPNSRQTRTRFCYLLWEARTH